MSEKITAPAILARKNGQKLTMVTAYDATSAQIADSAAVDMLLVGDSLGMVVLGHEDTLAVTVDIMLHHASAVTRTNPNALVVVDMPWLSYHVSVEESVRNAGRLIREGKAGAVKLEGGRKRLPVVRAILDAEIPVMGHLGLTPQSVHAMGGYKVQGKSIQAARDLIADAKALAQAGVFAIVLEGIPDSLAQIVTQEVAVPTIGIGAGPHCDGQVLVFHDLLGLHKQPVAKFVRKYANLADTATEAIQRYSADVREGSFPAEKETYHMEKSVLEALLKEREQNIED